MIVNTEGPIDAKIFIVGEAPCKEDDMLGKPFRGYAGKILTSLCTQVGISRYECLIGNVAKQRPPGNKICYYFQDKKCTIPKIELLKWIEELRQELIKYKPNVIVALGSTALWALTGEKKISQFRGTIMPCKLVPGLKVLPTYHPQAVGYDSKLSFAVAQDLKKAKHHSTFPEIPEDKRVFIAGSTKNQFIEYCKEACASNWKISLDLETSQPGTYPSIVGLSHSKDFGISLRFLSGKIPCFSERDELEILHWLSKVCNTQKLIMQNAQFDMGVLLYHFGIHSYNNIAIDTLLAAHCCWPETPRDLGFLASVCIDVPAWKHTSHENPCLYNAQDAANTYGISEVLEKQIDYLKVRETFNFEMSELEVALMMQLQGLKVHDETRKKLVTESQIICKETSELLTTLIGRTINYNSSKQLQKLLYIDLGLPPQYKRRKSVNDERKITSDAPAIKKLKTLVKDNPIFDLILKYKEHNKLLSAFLFESGKQYLSPENKVHTCYNITGSAVDNEGKKSFGRWSSSRSIIRPFGSGNLQNNPLSARKMYRAESGHKIIQADYVQAEAVVVSYLINDQRMKKLFIDRYNAPVSKKKEFDVHKMTASILFGIPFEEVTEELRKIGKRLRHAISYSAGPQVVADSIGCSLSEAKKLLETYHRTFPQLKMWYVRIQTQLSETRSLTNMLGRKHKFLDQWGDSLFRSAYAFNPQSTVGDHLNKSLVQLYHEYGNIMQIVLQLHDAIYVMVKEDDLEKSIRILKKVMTRPILINGEEMIIEVDFKVGDSWGEMEEYEEKD